MIFISIYVKFLKIKLKSNQFVGNKYRASDFLKNQRKKEDLQPHLL